jgi:hypothetical protein
MWAAKHRSILFSSILQQHDRFYTCRQRLWPWRLFVVFTPMQSRVWLNTRSAIRLFSFCLTTVLRQNFVIG